MAVTTNTIGTYTYQLDYPAGTTVGELQTAIDAVLVAHGWDQYDAAAGTNAIAYRALNKDGSTYKYVVIDLNTAGYVICNVYESWDSGAHTGTNVCNISGVTTWQKVDLAAGALLYINLCARWLVFLARVGGIYGSGIAANAITGCFEITRDNPEDTVGAGYPCWGLASAQETNAGYGSGIGVNSNYPVFLPRTRGAYTGSNAICLVASLVGGAVSGPATTVKTSVASVWSGKYQAWTLWALERSASFAYEYKGRFFGPKFMAATASIAMMDEVDLKVDADLFINSTGADVTHLILGATSTNNYRIALPK